MLMVLKPTNSASGTKKGLAFPTHRNQLLLNRSLALAEIFSVFSLEYLIVPYLLSYCRTAPKRLNRAIELKFIIVTTPQRNVLKFLGSTN